MSTDVLESVPERARAVDVEVDDEDEEEDELAWAEDDSVMNVDGKGESGGRDDDEGDGLTVVNVDTVVRSVTVVMVVDSVTVVSD